MLSIIFTEQCLNYGQTFNTSNNSGGTFINVAGDYMVNGDQLLGQYYMCKMTYVQLILA